MSNLPKKFQGQILRQTEKAVEISIMMPNGKLLSEWFPKSAINMKVMEKDFLINPLIQTFYIYEWFIDLKAKENKTEKKTETEFLKTAETAEIPHIPDISGPYNTSQHKPAPKITTVNMPYNPNVIESEFVFYPAFDYPKLRIMHTKEPNIAIRAHIELVMQNKQIIDLLKEMKSK